MKPNLVLGTVAFGLDGYSIPNSNKPRPNKREVFKMLEYAKNNGIHRVDTAHNYGCAQKLLGEFGANNFLITSKLRANCFDGLTAKNYKDVAIRECESDLKDLAIDRLYGYYFHTPSYIHDQVKIDAAAECKRLGLVERIGVSIYEPNDALKAVEMGVDIIQIPYNVLDQRLHYTNFFEGAKKKHIEVDGRSPFIKGLLTIGHNRIPEYLLSTTEYIKKLEQTCGNEVITHALSFSLHNNYLSGVVFGVEKLSQLKENIDIYKSIPDMELLGRISNGIDDYIITPSLWGVK